MITAPKGSEAILINANRCGCKIWIDRVNDAKYAIIPFGVTPDDEWIAQVKESDLPVLYALPTRLPSGLRGYVSLVELLDGHKIMKQVEVMVADLNRFSTKSIEIISSDELPDTSLQHVYWNNCISVCIIPNEDDAVNDFVENLKNQSFDLKHVELCVIDKGGVYDRADVDYSNVFGQVKHVICDNDIEPQSVTSYSKLIVLKSANDCASEDTIQNAFDEQKDADDNDLVTYGILDPDVKISLYNDNNDAPPITYIIPFKPSDDRVELLRRVVDNLSNQSISNIEIIISAQSMSPISIPGAHRICYTTFSDDIHLAELINKGVTRARAKYAVIHDADTIVGYRYTEAVLAYLNAGYKSARLGSSITKLTMKATADAFQHDDIVQWAADSRITETISDFVNNENGRRFNKFPGGSTAISKDAFAEIGGFNEEYIGWGYSDVAFHSKIVNTFCHRHAEHSLYPFIHLFHEDADKSNQEANRKVYDTECNTGWKDVVAKDRAVFESKYGK